MFYSKLIHYPVNAWRAIRSDRHVIKRILSYLRPHVKRLLITNLCMLIGSATGLVTPYFVGKFFDAATLKGGNSELNSIAIMFVALTLLGAFTIYIQSFLSGKTNTITLRQLRLDLFTHVLKLDLAFHETKSPGELISRLNSDLAVIQSFITTSISTGIRGVIQSAGSITILFYIQPKLAAFTLLILIPPIIISARIASRIQRRLSREQQDAQAHSSGLAEEAFNGIRTVKAIGRESCESSKYGNALDVLWNLQIRSIQVNSALSSTSSFITSAALLLFLWYGGKLMLHGEVSAGQLASFMMYGSTCFGGITSFFTLFTGYHTAVGACTQVFQILDTPCRLEPVLTAPTNALSRFRGKVSFKDVSFKYPQGKNRYALENLSFDAMPGEIVGIVGPSGAGKSTLFLLLMGFYDIDSGSIAIDDRNLNTVEAPHLRQNIAIVPQDIFLFSGTVEENIRYGRLDASPEEIRTVAKQAGAHDFIEQFPNGYRETVGNKGFKLSAGQRQRLAIARALLANPSILLLDEATSSLDADSEELVGKALITLFRNRTTLVIAHRLITARRADRILVVEKGKIITSGTHDFLYSNDSLYRRYWDLQSQTKSFELRPEGSFQGSPLSGAPIT